MDDNNIGCLKATVAHVFVLRLAAEISSKKSFFRFDAPLSSVLLHTIPVTNVKHRQSIISLMFDRKSCCEA
jgi:hypothetical protein